MRVITDAHINSSTVDIQALPSLSSAALSDAIMILDATTGTSKKITVSDIRNAIDKTYTTTFTDVDGSLDVTHNLNKRVAVQVVDNSGDDFSVSFSYDAVDPLNKVTVSWGGIASGTVICN